MHPCAFILTPDRTKSTYKKMLRQLKQCATVNLQPSQVFVDFEEGAIRAFKEEFPGVQVKGCHFHFTQCIWRKIQELGLSVEYKEDKKVRVWLEFFKTMAFIPIDLLDSTFQYLLSIQPESLNSDKLRLFVNYFESTWIGRDSKFPKDMWNHYETIGPRSNNHVEGYNLKFNRYVETIHPNVYKLIQDMRDQEAFCSMNYIQRNNGRLSKSFRRPIDIKRDDILFNLKTLFFYQSISLNNSISYASRLFSYDQNVKLTKLDKEEIEDDIYSYLDHDMPINLDYLQSKSFQYIKNYVSLNKSQFIELVKVIRGLNMPLYNDQHLDLNYSDLAEQVSKDYVPIFTSPNGNCLFNAISINLCGSEALSLKIKLASLFICFEYEYIN